jgi:geranylgeranyl reductase family protein
VGAGPAGATAAASLARRGRDVVLLDRCDFPRDKACGDGIPPGTVGILNRLGMGEALRGAGFYPIHGIRIGSPGGRTWETAFRSRKEGADFYVAPRRRFDALIQRHAVRCGARFQKAQVRGLVTESGQARGVVALVDGKERELRSEVVIGADGATSVVARSLGRPRSVRVARGVALRAYVEGITTLPHRIEFHFERELLPGYGWVFPMGPDCANVGVLLRADRLQAARRPLRGYFDAFLEGRSLRGRLASGTAVSGPATWQLPYAGPHDGARSFSGALLVGDAAGLVDALTGEGIHHALVSATIAADVTDEALAAGDTGAGRLSAYDRRCEAELGRLVRRSWRLQHYVARWPLALEALFLAARAGGGAVQSFINRVSTDFVAEG